MPVYKDDTRGTWYTSFYYTDWQGKRKKKKKEGFAKKKDAQKFERQFISQQKGSCDMLFKDMVALYLADKKVKLKITTYLDKEFIFLNRLNPVFGDRQVSSITSNDVRLWHNSLLENNSYKPTYLRKLNAQLSALFNFAVKYYGLHQNPVALCENIGKGTANIMQFWTVEDFKKFMACLRDDKALKIAFEILFWTGLRCGELMALTWSDVDMSGHKISINKTLARIKGKDVIQSPKTPKSNRLIGIPEFLCNDMLNYKKSLYCITSADRVCTVSKYAMYRAIASTSKIAGIKPIRIHDLRHSHASLLIELGFSPLAISERLGHEKIQTTLEIYGHLYPNKQEEIVQKLQNLGK
jgi:integrase